MWKLVHWQNCLLMSLWLGIGHLLICKQTQGKNFESNLVKEICRLLGIVKTQTTPYHPQSDGMIEMFNRTLLSMLKRATIDAESH